MNPSEKELEFKRLNLPDKPGCYLYLNSEGEIIYIGKAKSLKKRVNSYWKPRNKNEDPIYNQKIERLVKEIRDIDVFIVENETEALILENELIKRHQPIYNVDLKDDKSFPWVRITNEEFPRIRIIRGPERYGLQHRYIGPFVSTNDLKKTLKFIRKIFPYCSCKKASTRNNRKRPCIYYQIKLCPAPCIKKISKEDYAINIENIQLLLIGEIELIQNMIKENMERSSEKLNFEEAAVWRDRLEALTMFTISQSILSYEFKKSTDKNNDKNKNKNKNNDKNNDKKRNSDEYYLEKPRGKNIDVIAGHYSKKRAGILIIHVRNGKVIGKTPHIFKLKDKIVSKSNFSTILIEQHYLRPNIPLPDEIVIENPLPKELEVGLSNYFNENISELKDVLYKKERKERKEKKDKKKFNEIKKIVAKRKNIKFKKPTEDDKSAGILRIGKKNIELLISQKDEYEQYLKEDYKKEQIKSGLSELRQILNLDALPLIIEGLDMAHLQGSDYTGSKVRFIEGKPSKKHYRRYKIKTVDQPDDIAAMKEVMTRCYTKAIKNDNLPDLVVVDGGRAQLNMAHKLFLNLGIEDIPHIGLVKPEGRSEIYKVPGIVLPEEKEILKLSKDSSALKIIQHLRDESHRFANKYHRKLREKRATESELDEIAGIGPARKKKLLQFFGSTDKIKKASKEEIQKIIGKSIGNRIFEHFKSKKIKNNQKIEKKTRKKRYRIKKKN